MARLTKENGDLRERLSNLGEETDTALYNNLTYPQMKALLVKEEIEDEEGNTNLFEVMMYLAPSLSVIVYNMSDTYKRNKLAIRKLVNYKVVAERRKGLQPSDYTFTKDGHNFYLKALALAAQGK